MWFIELLPDICRTKRRGEFIDEGADIFEKGVCFVKFSPKLVLFGFSLLWKQFPDGKLFFCLVQELATLRVTLKQQRSINENLKRMKVCLNTSNAPSFCQ